MQNIFLQFGLAGTIPTLEGCTWLQRLGLDGNRLTGTIPSAIGQLTKLKEIHLANNSLSGLECVVAMVRQLLTFYLRHDSSIIWQASKT